MALSPAFSSRYFLRYLSFLFVLLGTTACDPVSLVLLPGAVVGFAEADERRLGGVASDTAIRTKINCAWLQDEPVLLDHVTLSVIEGRVLLTGTVETAALKQKAVELTQQVSGVKAVTDEIRVGPTETLGDYSRDSWITTKLKTNLLFEERIASRNYTIRTVNRTVYLTGIAQNQQELDLVIDCAKEISGVKRVVNYVRVKPLQPAIVPGDNTRAEEPLDGDETSSAS